MHEAQVLKENNRRPFMEFPWGVTPRHALGILNVFSVFPSKVR